MANSWATSLVLIGIGVGLGTAFDAFGQIQTGAFHHPGRVIDRNNQKPVEASVNAWSQSTKTVYSGTCPEFGKDALDATTSDPANGLFSLTIDRKNPTYTVTYCASGYVPMYNRFQPNRNLADGRENPVNPFPALLWPVNASPTDAAFYEAIERRVLASMNDLGYLHSVNPQAFDKDIAGAATEISKSSEAHANIVRSLATLVGDWDR